MEDNNKEIITGILKLAESIKKIGEGIDGIGEFIIDFEDAPFDSEYITNLIKELKQFHKVAFTAFLKLIENTSDITIPSEIKSRKEIKNNRI